MIEKSYYHIISRGEKKPEKEPKVYDVISLNVSHAKIDPLTNESVKRDRAGEEVGEARLVAEHIDMLGPYVHVIGLVTISHSRAVNNLPANAKYLIDADMAKGEKIGDLSVSRPVNISTSEQVE